jgi:hypothetical protein
MSDDGGLSLSAIPKTRHVLSLLFGVVGLVIAGGLLTAGVLPATPANVAVLVGVVILLALPIYRRLS